MQFPPAVCEKCIFLLAEEWKKQKKNLQDVKAVFVVVYMKALIVAFYNSCLRNPVVNIVFKGQATVRACEKML